MTKKWKKSFSDFEQNRQFLKILQISEKMNKKLIILHKSEIFFIKNIHSVEKYYLSSIKKVLTQKWKI